MLDPEQQIVVMSESSVIMVIAGPGSGKTHTLIERVIHLIDDKKIDPPKILIVTFTQKAAEELTNRIKLRINKSNTPIIQTLHAWCYMVLSEEYPNPPNLLDDSKRIEIIQTICKSLGISESSHVANGISLFKANDETILDKDSLRAYESYTNYLNDINSLDFDDLILKTYSLFIESPEKLKKYQNRYSHVLVDEYQDLNKTQQQLLQLLTQYSSLFVIGDPKQAIYGFRGANTQGFDDLADIFPNIKIVHLKKNYRSGQGIIDAAYCLFPNDTTQYSALSYDSKTYFKTIDTEKDEARFITGEIQKLIGGVRRQDYDTGEIHSSIEGEYTFGDFAILLRSRFQGEVIQQTLVKRGLPFIFQKTEKMQNDAINEALDTLKNFDTKTIPYNIPLSQLVTDIFTRFEIPKELSRPYLHQAKLIESREIANDLPMFCEITKIIASDSQNAISSEKINVITVHASKGLEWPVVFIPGLTDGIFPYTAKNKHDIDEERRLLFVAMTRAKEKLYLSQPSRYILYGKSYNTTSRFIRDVPQSFLEKIEEPKSERRPRSAQAKLF